MEKYNYGVTIDRVVDGDTLDVMIDLGFNTHIKRRIRMYGINAPESRTRDLEEKARGLASKERLIEMLDEDNIVMKSHGKGKFGRVLGELFVKKENEYISVNDLLVKEGFAKEYFGGKR
jgi:micrococcal nuclease|tara:strand:- start:3394 stop:3750 length:357 start_codon:yes stop_codon:yes gene_type:complete